MAHVIYGLVVGLVYSLLVCALQLPTQRRMPSVFSCWSCGQALRR